MLSLEDSNETGLEKVYYYYIMKKISINKSSYDIDNEDIFPVSGSSQKYGIYWTVMMKRKRHLIFMILIGLILVYQKV